MFSIRLPFHGLFVPASNDPNFPFDLVYVTHPDHETIKNVPMIVLTRNAEDYDTDIEMYKSFFQVFMFDVIAHLILSESAPFEFLYSALGLEVRKKDDTQSSPITKRQKPDENEMSHEDDKEAQEKLKSRKGIARNFCNRFGDAIALSGRGTDDGADGYFLYKEYVHEIDLLEWKNLVPIDWMHRGADVGSVEEGKSWYADISLADVAKRFSEAKEKTKLGFRSVVNEIKARGAAARFIGSEMREKIVQLLQPRTQAESLANIQAVLDGAKEVSETMNAESRVVQNGDSSVTIYPLPRSEGGGEVNKIEIISLFSDENGIPIQTKEDLVKTFVHDDDDIFNQSMLVFDQAGYDLGELVKDLPEPVRTETIQSFFRMIDEDVSTDDKLAPLVKLRNEVLSGVQDLENEGRGAIAAHKTRAASGFSRQDFDDMLERIRSKKPLKAVDPNDVWEVANHHTDSSDEEDSSEEEDSLKLRERKLSIAQRTKMDQRNKRKAKYVRKRLQKRSRRDESDESDESDEEEFDDNDDSNLRRCCARVGCMRRTMMTKVHSKTKAKDASFYDILITTAKVLASVAAITAFSGTVAMTAGGIAFHYGAIDADTPIFRVFLDYIQSAAYVAELVKQSNAEGVYKAQADHFISLAQRFSSSGLNMAQDGVYQTGERMWAGGAAGWTYMAETAQSMINNMAAYDQAMGGVFSRQMSPEKMRAFGENFRADIPNGTPIGGGNMAGRLGDVREDGIENFKIIVGIAKGVGMRVGQSGLKLIGNGAVGAFVFIAQGFQRQHRFID